MAGGSWPADFILVALVSDLSRPTLNTLGQMFLHLSPLVSLLVSLLRHSWPDALTLVTLAFHLPPLVSLCLAPCLDTLCRAIARQTTTFATHSWWVESC